MSTGAADTAREALELLYADALEIYEAGAGGGDDSACAARHPETT